MALSINTNISSLTAQRAIADSKNDLETAMERLSTGSKINSASDDAAGLAMAQRMTAQIQGLNMAIKNSNDGIAMTKSIEGAIAEVSDMLQRMRELSIQAANGTNSASDRTYLQDEVNLLIQEITRVSANTRYNGSLILDGTFINKQLQVGIEEGEHITFSVDSVASNQIGAHTLVGNGVNPEDPAAAAPSNPVTTDEDIEIFGYLGTKTVESSTKDTAKEVATKVNLLTAETGVKAYAKTYAALSSSDATARTYNIKINDFQTGNFIISSTDVGDAVEAINRISGASGVTAKVDNNKVVLFDADGDDITIENTKTGSEFTDLVIEKLGEDGLVSNVIGASVALGEGATAGSAESVLLDFGKTSNTDTLASLGTKHVDAVNLFAQYSSLSSGQTLVINYAGAAQLTLTKAASNEAAQTGVTSTTLGNDIASASALATRIQSVVANLSLGYSVADNAGTMEFTSTAVGPIGANGLTVTANTVAVTNAASPTTGAYDTVTFNGAGENITLTLLDDSNATGLNIDKDASVAAFAAAFEAAKSADSAVSFSAENGKLKVTYATMGDKTNITANNFVFNTSSTSVTPTVTDGVPGDATRISGTLKFVSANSFSVEQAGNASGNRGYFAAGSQTASLVDLTQVKISTESGASDAISIIDAALDKVAQMRSDLGAIENRMDHTISNLMNIAEKTADSRSRLEDADFALESARLAKNQVLQQAGTSMLSQANQMNQMVMELLRG